MKRILAAAMLALFAALAFSQESAVFKIGFVDPDPNTIIKKTKPFTDYMAAALAQQGITSATVVVAKDTAEMASLIKSGKVDIYIDTAYAILDVARSSKIEYPFRRWKKGVSEYHSMLVVKADSPIKDLSSLAGLKIGFEDVSSTSGRWLAQVMLQDKGYSFADISSGQAGGAKAIGYVFTGSADNTPVWVIQGKIDIGVISSNDYDGIAQALKSKVRVLAESSPVARQFIALRTSLPAALKAALKKAFLEADKTDAGKAMLAAWEKTTKIDELGAADATAIQALSKKIFK